MISDVLNFDLTTIGSRSATTVEVTRFLRQRRTCVAVLWKYGMTSRMVKVVKGTRFYCGTKDVCGLNNRCSNFTRVIFATTITHYAFDIRVNCTSATLIIEFGSNTNNSIVRGYATREVIIARGISWYVYLNFRSRLTRRFLRSFVNFLCYINEAFTSERDIRMLRLFQYSLFRFSISRIYTTRTIVRDTLNGYTSDITSVKLRSGTFYTTSVWVAF